MTRSLKACLFFLLIVTFSFSHAARLGRLSVLSSLGQPLRAEIEITDILPEESALSVALAPEIAYKRSGLDYTNLLRSLDITVQKQGDRNFVRIRSPQAVNEPYLGLLLEIASVKERRGQEYVITLDPAEWTSLRTAPLSSMAAITQLEQQRTIGRLVTENQLRSPVDDGIRPSEVIVDSTPTVMADAKAVEESQSDQESQQTLQNQDVVRTSDEMESQQTVVAEKTSQSEKVVTAQEAKPDDSKKEDLAQVNETKSEEKGTEPVQESAEPVSKVKRQRPTRVVEQTESAEQRPTTYKVAKGDTLSEIAIRHAQPNISLEQMLVLLYRNNPGAFLDDNMNLLKKGALLKLPQEDPEVSKKEAHTIVNLHANNFREYSQKLASTVQRSSPRSGKKTSAIAEGKITTRVAETPTPVTKSPDRLELSGARPTDKVMGMTQEEKIAITKSIEDTNKRIGELEKNVTQMKSLLEVISKRGVAVSQPTSKNNLQSNKSEEPPTKENKNVANAASKDASKATNKNNLSAQPSDKKETNVVGNIPMSDLKAIDPSQKVNSEEGVNPDESSIVANKTDKKATPKPKKEEEEKTDDEDEDEEEDTDETQSKQSKLAYFIQQLKTNLIWQIAAGVIVALILLLIFLKAKRKKNAPEKNGNRARNAVAKMPPMESSKPVEPESATVISGKDFLMQLKAERPDEDEVALSSDDTDQIPKESLAEDEQDIDEEPTQKAESEPAQEPVSPPESESEPLDLETKPESLETENSPEKEEQEDSPELDLSDINLETDPKEEETKSQDSAVDEPVDNAEMAAKLELALAYIDMKDKEGAKELLEEVIAKGTPEQQEEARQSMLYL